MKSFFLSALLVAASFSTAFAQAQQPVAADSWLDEPTVAPAAPETSASAEASTYSMSWSTAPGHSLSLHDRPTTDYWGRPLNKQKRANRTTTAAGSVGHVEEDTTDPMMRSSGVMIAPGMNTAPYRGVSTDYWGRPLKKKSKGASTLGANTQKASSVASSTAGGW